MRSFRLSRKDLGLFALAMLSAWAPQARADFYIHHWDLQREKHEDARFGLGIPIYLSSQNYGSDGTQFQPPGFDSLTRWGLDASLAYGLGDRFTVYGRLTWAWERVKADQRGGTAYGFADQTAGASFRLLESDTVAVDFQSQIDFAVYDNHSADNQRTPYLGDGTLDITFGGFGTFALSRSEAGSLDLVPGMGFTFRNDGFSSALPWTVTANWTHAGTAGMTGRLGFTGLQSLKNDRDTNLQQAISPTYSERSYGTGGSFWSNAINPSLVTLRAGIGYETTTRWAFNATVDRSIWGRNAPVGTTFLLAVEWRSDRSGQANEKSESPAAPIPTPAAESGAKKPYDLDARVLSTNDRMNLIKIDKGKQDGVAVDQVFDLFSMAADGAALERIARAKVISVTDDETALQITEYFKQVWIDEGFPARRVSAGPGK